MKNKKIVLIQCFFILLFCFPNSSHCAPNRIESLILSEPENSTTILIESEKPLKYFTTESANPPSMMIHFEEDVLSDRENFKNYPDHLLQNIQYNYVDPTPYKQSMQIIKSISFTFKTKSDYTISQKDWTLTIILKPNVVSNSETPKPITSNLMGYSYNDDIEIPRMTLPRQPAVDDFIKVGLANHGPLETAQKELILAKKKLFEAKRSFFPALTGRITETKGKTLTTINDPSSQSEFTRRERGLEIGQPLFQSGRIYFSKKQASAQVEVSELQIQKTIQETTFAVLRALYTYLQNSEAFEMRKNLVIKAEKITENTKRKRNIGIASESEYLGAQASEIQIKYKAVSQEKELEISKANLMSVLNLSLLPNEFNLTIEQIVNKLPKTDFNLQEMILKALSSRPEIKIAYYNQKARDYAKRIARADNLFKLDASGFVGQSGAAFSNESFIFKDSYNIGVKASLFFGGSSINPLASKEKTAPDLGSTSRTETESQSMTVGVLDSLGAGSNYYQSQIEENKARDEFKKIKKDVILEVKESFYNYQKARIQIESALKELEYRKKEFAIAETRDRLHQIESTEYLQSLSSLSEAEIALKEASAFSAITIFALEKATGLKLIWY